MRNASKDYYSCEINILIREYMTIKKEFMIIIDYIFY